MSKFIKKHCSIVVSYLLMGCILLVGVTGCDDTKQTQNPKTTEALTTPTQTMPTQPTPTLVISSTKTMPTQPTPTLVISSTETMPTQPTPTVTAPMQTTSVPDIQDNEDKSKIDISNFKFIKDNFIDYDFNVKKNGTESQPHSFLAEGEYDLNKDGKSDKINLMLKGFGGGEEVQSYIEVNGIRQDFYMELSPDGEVGIIDLDNNDEFFEVAYFDKGPSDYPHYVFYRYDGKRLYSIGNIDSRGLCDGEGKLLLQYYISRFRPVFCSAWLEIENDKFVEKSNDITEYLGKNYMFNGGGADFIPCDEMPKDFEPRWDDLKQFQPFGLKLIDIYFWPNSRVLNCYFVEFSNGERGMLYYLIGE